jgi:CubicO group peptidase (beta-lactamase class C family)
VRPPPVSGVVRVIVVLSRAGVASYNKRDDLRSLELHGACASRTVPTPASNVPDMTGHRAAYSRREWLGIVAAGAGAIGVSGCSTSDLSTLSNRSDHSVQPDHVGRPELDAYIERVMREKKVPGLTAAIVKGSTVVWSHGYGWANVGKRVPMDPDRTVQNIASVSKTITATALMQLFERKQFALDDDVNRFLPFPVRSPHFPDVPITFRQLLTHRSGIADGPAYGAGYACGDPTMDLRSWLAAYLTPTGKFYDPKTNWHPWTPGDQGELTSPLGRNYSNVGFGLIGFLVESISKVPFPQYCRQYIFAPLGMTHSAWKIADVDPTTHAFPYISPETAAPKEIDQLQKGGFVGKPERADPTSTTYLPYCLYSFPNYPDGTLRTSATQLAQFLLAYMNGGANAMGRILAPETVTSMLSPQVRGGRSQGLAWVTDVRDGARYWGHDGGDPGVTTMMHFRPSDGVGVVVLATSLGNAVVDVSRRLFEEAREF